MMGTFVPKSADEYVEELSGDFDRIIKNFKNDIEKMNENSNSDEDFWDEYYEKLSKLIENMREKLSKNGVYLPSGVYNDYMKKGTKEIFKRCVGEIMTENNHIPVFYEGQDDLIEILATSMASVCYTTKSFIDFYILDCGICDFNKRQLEGMKEKFNNFSLEFIPIDLKQFEGLKGYTANNYVDCYSRLLIPELKPDLDKAIYLDVDVVALDDINLLWNENLNGHEIAACADLGYQKSVQDRCYSIGIPRNQIYCNAGVLIIDCAAWRKNEVSKKLLCLAKDIKNDIVYICEDLLNLYYKNNNYRLLDLRYNIHQLENFIGSVCAPQITDEYIENEWKKVVIQHLSPAKPWRIGEYRNLDLKHWSEFWFFAAMTPYYDGLALKFLNNSNKTMLGVTLSVLAGNKQRKSIKLFGFIPFLTFKRKNNKTYVILFGFIPLLKIK